MLRCSFGSTDEITHLGALKTVLTASLCSGKGKGWMMFSASFKFVSSKKNLYCTYEYNKKKKNCGDAYL
jgi:hypothetical protein